MKNETLRRLWPAAAGFAGVVTLAAVAGVLLVNHGGGAKASAATATRQTAPAPAVDGAGGARPGAAGGVGVTDQQGSTRGFLGVSVSEESGKLTVTSVVSGGPADKAGVKKDDVITAVDGATIAAFADLRKALSGKKAGDSVTLSVDRGGSRQDIKVTLGDAQSAGLNLPFRGGTPVPGGRAGGGLPGLPALGPLLSGGFDHFISNEARTKDDNGQVHTDKTVGGTVKSVSGSQVVVTLNGGGDQTFTTDSNTRILKAPRAGGGQGGATLAQNDKVIVNTRDGAATPNWILVIDPNGFRGVFGGQNGGPGFSGGNGEINIQLPGGQSLTLPLPDFGEQNTLPTPGGSPARGSRGGPTY